MRAARFEERKFFGERGFTLVELLAGIVILGVLVSIAVVIFLGVLEQRRVDAAATQFASDLRLAHTSATNQLTDWRVVFMPDGSPLPGCGEAEAVDYCMVKLLAGQPSSTYPPPASPVVAEVEPRYFPEGAGIKETNFGVDCLVGGTYAAVTPSKCLVTNTVEFNVNGTARTLKNGVSGSLIISSTDGNPTHRVSFRTPTSRVRIVRNCAEPLCP